jgi:cytochrome c553
MNRWTAPLLFATLIPLVAACQSQTQPPPAAATAPEAAKPSPVERGKYLVEAVAGCDDCHTPKTMGPNGPEPDMTRRLSGHPEKPELGAVPKMAGGWALAGSPDLTAWAGPWGVSYTANLTPDQNTGLGIWTEDMFIKTMRLGKHMGQSRPVLPPMPWEVFRNMTDDDLKAIFAFLRTLPPVSNHVPEPLSPATH